MRSPKNRKFVKYYSIIIKNKKYYVEREKKEIIHLGYVKVDKLNYSFENDINIDADFPARKGPPSR